MKQMKNLCGGLHFAGGAESRVFLNFDFSLLFRNAIVACALDSVAFESIPVMQDMMHHLPAYATDVRHIGHKMWLLHFGT